MSSFAAEPSACNWNFLALVGPTASGKTNAAMRLSERYNIELISMDSALVYQGMDIGTAKPNAHELQSVPHHLIDIRRAHEPFSAADFAEQAKALVAEIGSRGAIPVVVGGTLLYFNALVKGLDDLPAASQDIRQTILLEAQALGWPKMHEKLHLVDPTTAKRLAPKDSQRIARALEVWMLTGQSISSFQSKYSEQKNELHDSNLLTYHVLSFEPRERAWLHANIERRFDQMLKNGFLKESLSFFKDPQLNASMPSMRCVGYRQAWLFWQSIESMRGALPDPNDLQDLIKTPQYELFVQSSLAATRQLAKRQLTWLRSMKDRHVIECDANDFELQVQTHLDQVIDQHVLFKRFVK